jgi:O-antigen/teichoic acid export membrane protein
VSTQARSLTAGRLLARNTVLNLVGAGAPLLVAFVAVPRLVAGLGADRFGLLTLVWVVIGYFGFFDLGLGWALTKLVADRIGADRGEEVPTLAWTALAIMTAFGIVGGIVLAGLARWLVASVLTVPPELQAEGRTAFRCVAVSIPFVIAAAGLRGLLAAFQRFDLITAIRVPMGVFTYLAPLAVLVLSRSLPAVVAVLVAGRIASAVAHLLLCRRVVPGFGRSLAFDPAVIRPLLGFGGWLTVSNVVSPLMVSADRFVIGALLSVSAVTFYATPYEVVTKLLVFPSVVLGVLFPALAITLQNEPVRAGRLYSRGTAAVYAILLPVLLVLATFAPEGLDRWLGGEFALRSTFVLRALAVGVFVNGIAQVAFGLIQGAGRPDLTARLHLGELVIYAPLLAWLVHRWGIRGAAVAWAVRATIDAGALLAFTRGRAPGMKARVLRVAAGVAIAIAAFVFCVTGGGVAARAIRLLIALAVVAGTVGLLLRPGRETAA